MGDHEAVFEYFVAEAKAHAGAALRSVVVYGSALSEQFRPGRSDYNFLLVVNPCDLALLDRLAARMGRWRKKQISPPLLVTADFLSSARDSYPLELIAIQAGYRVLHGDDPLAAIGFQREHVRLQCEREIRSKLLLFRRAYLESEGSPRRLQQLINRGLPSLVAILRGLLWLKNGPWQASGAAFWQACEENLPLAPGLLAELERTRSRGSVPLREEIRAQIEKVLQGLETLAGEIDRW